jgi:hypothetical protein
LSGDAQATDQQLATIYIYAVISWHDHFQATERGSLQSPSSEEEQHGLTGLDYEERALSLPAKEILRLHDNVAIGQSSRS